MVCSFCPKVPSGGEPASFLHILDSTPLCCSGADSKPKPKRSRARATKDGGGPSGSRGGGSKGAKEKMLPRARSHNDLAGMLKKLQLAAASSGERG